MTTPSPHHLNLFEIPRGFDGSALMDFESADRESSIHIAKQLELIKTSRVERQRDASEQTLNRSDNRSLGRGFDSNNS